MSGSSSSAGLRLPCHFARRSSSAGPTPLPMKLTEGAEGEQQSGDQKVLHGVFSFLRLTGFCSFLSTVSHKTGKKVYNNKVAPEHSDGNFAFTCGLFVRVFHRGGDLCRLRRGGVLMLCEGQGDDLVALLLEAHDDDALGGPARGADVLHRGADQDAGAGSRAAGPRCRPRP